MGVPVTLAGALSLAPALIKDFKLFGSLVERIQLVLGSSSAPPVLNLESEPHLCVVGPFGDGDAHIPPRRQGGAPNLKQLASDCAKAVVPPGRKVVQITLVGHVDMRELGRRASRDYGSNFNLAYQRALAVLPFIECALAASPGDQPNGPRARITLLGAGPEHVSPPVSQEQLSSDRSVEIRTVLISLASSPSTGPPSP